MGDDEKALKIKWVITLICALKQKYFELCKVEIWYHDGLFADVYNW